MTRPAYAPAATSRRVALVAAAVAALTAFYNTYLAAVLGPVGFAAVFLSLRRGSHRALLAGVGTLMFAVLLGGGGLVSGGESSGFPSAYLLGTVAAFVAWDAGERAVTLGRQLGADVDTAGMERRRALASVGVGTGAAVAAFGVYVVAVPGKSSVGTAMVLLGVVVLLAAFDR